MFQSYDYHINVENFNESSDDNNTSQLPPVENQSDRSRSVRVIRRP